MKASFERKKKVINYYFYHIFRVFRQTTVWESIFLQKHVSKEMCYFCQQYLFENKNCFVILMHQIQTLLADRSIFRWRYCNTFPLLLYMHKMFYKNKESFDLVHWVKCTQNLFSFHFHSLMLAVHVKLNYISYIAFKNNLLKVNSLGITYLRFTDKCLFIIVNFVKMCI